MASTFKLFSWKRKTTNRSQEPPQVIVSQAEDDYVQQASSSKPAARSSSAYAPDGSSHLAQQLQRSRTSSRPTSPSTATFGTAGPHWARRPSYERQPEQAQARTPPSSSSNLTGAACRAVHGDSAAPQWTASQYESQKAFRRQSTEQCRVHSMYASSAGSTTSLNTIKDYTRTPLCGSRRQSQTSQIDRGSLTPEPVLPMFNIIPATPQQADMDTGSSKRRSSWVVSRASTSTQDDAIYRGHTHSPEMQHQVESRELVCSDEFSQLPMIDVDLDFSPFSPVVELPDEQVEKAPLETSTSQRTILPPSGPLPPSPPFRSYDSLPSLSSVSSSLSTSSSLYSFPDVDEALGSMLASLSDPNLASLPEDDAVLKPLPVGESWSVEPTQLGVGLGLGLGLGLDNVPRIEATPSPSVTLPLTPRSQRRPPPPPLVLVTDILHKQATSVESSMPSSSPSTMSLMKNHRVAFYGNAKAHPASPSAGVFIGLDGVSPASSSNTPLPCSQPPQSASGYFPVFDSSSSASTPSSARSSTCSISSSDTGSSSSDSHSGSDAADDEDELAIRTASIVLLLPSPQLQSFHFESGLASPGHATDCPADPIVGWAL